MSCRAKVSIEKILIFDSRTEIFTSHAFSPSFWDLSSQKIKESWLRIYVQIVPGYYLRRNTDGFIENSTCINNTASEHFMVERLILDDLFCWAVHYKVIIVLYCLSVSSTNTSFEVLNNNIWAVAS